MHASDSLQAAIDQIYEAFRRYGRPKRLEASPSRDGGAILRTLLSAPLKELSGEQIGPYSGWAITTVGSAEDYKHFLPRILEVAVSGGEGPGTTPPVIAERLGLANWRRWPPKEQAAVCAVFAQAFEQARGEHPDVVDASAWLCGIAVLGEDLSRPLAAWVSSPSPNGALQLAYFVTTVGRRGLGAGGREPNGTWSAVAEPARGIVLTWMASDALKVALEATLDALTDQNRWGVMGALGELGPRSV